MKSSAAILAITLSTVPLIAQETKPVPKDSVRVSISGCTKGSIFTAGPRNPDQPGTVDLPVGMHLRMNGPRKMMAEIKGHEGSAIEITGLMKKGQYEPGGVAIGGGVRVGPGSAPTSGSVASSPGVNQIAIDLEGWRPTVGNCPSR